MRAVVRRGWRFLRLRTGRLVREVVEVVGTHGRMALARLRPPAETVIAAWPGHRSLETATRVAILHHWDPTGAFAVPATWQLRALEACGYTVVIVSNADPPLSRDTIEALAPATALILQRRNVGLDFGGWRAAIERVPALEALDELVLTNDSVFGPLGPLESALDRMPLAAADVWAMTDSHQHGWHLQSYFLRFGPAALRHPAFRRFWATVRPDAPRRWIIQHYELGLTRAMTAAGLRCRALCPCDSIPGIVLQRRKRHAILNRHRPVFRLERRVTAWRLRRLRRRPVNPTHYAWDHLLDSAGMPYLKRDLLLRSVAEIAGLERWPEVVAARGVDPEEIRSALARHRGGPL